MHALVVPCRLQPLRFPRLTRQDVAREACCQRRDIHHWRGGGGAAASAVGGRATGISFVAPLHDSQLQREWRDLEASRRKVLEAHHRSHRNRAGGLSSTDGGSNSSDGGGGGGGSSSSSSSSSIVWPMTMASRK